MIIRRAFAYLAVLVTFPLVWTWDLFSGVHPRARLRTALGQVRRLYP